MITVFTKENIKNNIEFMDKLEDELYKIGNELNELLGKYDDGVYHVYDKSLKILEDNVFVREEFWTGDYCDIVDITFPLQLVYDEKYKEDYFQLNRDHMEAIQMDDDIETELRKTKFMEDKEEQERKKYLELKKKFEKELV